MTNTVKKVTKREKYAAIAAILKAAETAGMSLEEFDGITYEGLTDFVNHEVELLDAKAVKAKERAAEKKTEGDELRGKIFDVLSDEPMTIAQIVAALGDPDVTRNMVTSRLTQLGAKGTGQVEKTTADENGRKVSAYVKA